MTLEELLTRAREYRKLHEFTEEEKNKQAISFAYGNVKLHNPNLTREEVEKEALKIHGKSVLRD